MPVSPSELSSQTPYYEGLGFPVDRLSSDDFENFVFGCLISIQDVLGIRVTGKPSGSGDGGFDVQGEVVATSRLVCVQCKRQAQPLDMGQLVKELAKVAATSSLECSDIGEHRFICTGGVRKKLVGALRATSRGDIAAQAGDVLANSTEGELVSLRVKLEQLGRSPQMIAESYVLKLDCLTAWTLKEFDAALSPRWEAVLDVAQRYFRVATVVRDNPRAAFDRLSYISEYSHYNAILEPRLARVDLPAGISVGANFRVDFEHELKIKDFNNVDDFLRLDIGECALVIGQGGVGKTTILALIRSKVLQSGSESVLPVLISLSVYTPGALDRLINQELSASYGTWRLLPDKILLLCDGLNECTYANVSAFFDEIGPLLRRKRIACVLSSREPNRLNDIVLPQSPVGCVEVQNISLFDIRRIVEVELDPHSVESFTKYYMLLAENSRSSLFFSPFAVKIALRIWELKSAIPSTLGEMIEILLESRSIRNLGFPELKVHPTVIFQLASSLAFQCVFVGKCFEFPISEAGRWLREAKEHCKDTLGVGDLKEVEIYDLLVGQELLCVSRKGYIGFGHQLLVGSLASVILAQKWRDHLGSLRESLADDAWVFAASLVSIEHIEEFLKSVFDVDLVLGVRVAKELSDSFQEIAEEMLSRSIAAEAPEIFRLQGIYALARLGTPKAMRRLRELASEADSQMRYSAFRALASAGDEIYLRGLLPEIDKLKSTPMRISGGNVAIWEAAPLSVRISLARERLSECSVGVPVGESLLLLAYEKNPNDIPSIERHLRASADLTAFQTSLYVLYSIAPLQAKKIFDEVLSEHAEVHDKARLIRVAAGIGIDIDTRMAFECAVAEVATSEPDDHSEYYLQQLISDVLKTAEVPQDVAAVIERDLPQATGSRKARLWQIACRFESSVISLYAFSCIDKITSDLGSACNYFIAVVEGRYTPRQKLLSLCEARLSERVNTYEWTTSRVLALIGVLGFTVKAAASLSVMIERLAKVRNAVESGDCSNLTSPDFETLNSIKSEHKLIHLGSLAAGLIPAAAEARHLLSYHDLLLLLPFQTNGYEGLVECQREMLSDIDDMYVDEVLVGMSDRWARLSVLLIISDRKPNRIRLALLKADLLSYYSHPAALHILCQVVENFWCDDVLDVILDAVVSISVWQEQDTQFFWNFFHIVAKLLSVKNVPAIESAILPAKTQFAKRIIGLWREHVSGEKIGLARL
ncbi:hypothetical protein HX871_23750 [Pseudomonas reactans]|uniref:NACHT domain-containing protein n=1 Tax=Pseudomonas reactans TaxID=117680 RepID=A0ABX2R0G0_9PSED|nr:HEAT repeat domain-containing protein [Pseudomonas reactans]NWD97448.1 hypothetical protein [Pseudomonas reactans]